MNMKKWIKNKWFRRLVFTVIGGLVGFAYYYFIGCSGNTCPLSSNPYTMVGYGSLIGLVLSPGGKKTAGFTGERKSVEDCQ